MTNARTDLESKMKDILRYIILNGDIPKNADMDVLKACCDKGFLSGVETLTMISGRIVAEVSAPKVKIEGLNFLYPKKDIKFIISTSIAAVSMMLNVILVICA